VREALAALQADADEMGTWRELVAQEIQPPNDDEEFDCSAARKSR